VGDDKGDLGQEQRQNTRSELLDVLKLHGKNCVKDGWLHKLNQKPVDNKHQHGIDAKDWRERYFAVAGEDGERSMLYFSEKLGSRIQMLFRLQNITHASLKEFDEIDRAHCVEITASESRGSDQGVQGVDEANTFTFAAPSALDLKLWLKVLLPGNLLAPLLHQLSSPHMARPASASASAPTDEERTQGSLAPSLVPRPPCQPSPLGERAQSHRRLAQPAPRRSMLVPEVRRASMSVKAAINYQQCARTLFPMPHGTLACPGKEKLHSSNPFAELDEDGSGRLEYLRCCRRLEAKPSPLVLQQLLEPRLVLKDYALVKRATPSTAATTSTRDITTNAICSGTGTETLYPEAMALVQALTVNRKVREIFVSAPLSMDVGGEALMKAISTGNTVHKLTLQLKALSLPALSTLQEMLSSQSCLLQDLNLCSTLVGDKGMTMLSKGLRGNRVLHTLSLSNCKISAEGATALSQVLRSSGMLRELDVSWNYIPPAGIASICLAVAGSQAGPDVVLDSIHYASSITNLDISWNRIGCRDASGVSAVAQCLIHNSSLLRLDLRHSSLHADSEALILAKALKDNAPRLCMLRLEGNRICSSPALLRALMACAPLLSFYVQTEPATAGCQQMFASCLPQSALEDNPSGHYRLDLNDGMQLQLADFLLQRVLSDGLDTCRNEVLNGRYVRFSDLLELVRQKISDLRSTSASLVTGPSPEVSMERDVDVIDLDFIAPVVQGEEIDETNLQRARSAIKRANATITRLAILRRITADFVFDATSAMYLLTMLSPGIEREEGFIIMMSRMNQKTCSAIARLLGKPTLNNLIRRVGAFRVFDNTQVPGHYVLRLDRSADRKVLALLFKMAADHRGKKDGRKTRLASITVTGLAALAAASPPAVAAEAKLQRFQQQCSKGGAMERVSATSESEQSFCARSQAQEGDGVGFGRESFVNEIHHFLLSFDPRRAQLSEFEETNEGRLGLTLAENVLRKFCHTDNTSVLFRWSARATQENSCDGAKGDFSSDSVTLTGKSKVKKAQRIQADEFVEEHGRMRTDPLGDSPSMRAPGALSSVLLWLSAITELPLSLSLPQKIQQSSTLIPTGNDASSTSEAIISNLSPQGSHRTLSFRRTSSACMSECSDEVKQ
jgi:hypothetical protein